MIIDDDVFEKLKDIISAGLCDLENSKEYYDAVNDPNVADFIMTHGCSTSPF